MKARTRQVATDGADLTQDVLRLLQALLAATPRLGESGGRAVAQLSPMTELAYQQAEQQRRIEGP